jgi:toxin-antitoxin system PIN domain toxin
VLVDANILLYAVDEESGQHAAARDWMEAALNGSRRVGIPWTSITAFLRIATNPRALREPLSPSDAWEIVEAWLDAPSVWVPSPGPGHREILGRLVRDLDLRANLIPDAALAALCVEHGLEMISADTDFARFRMIGWSNPVAL